MTGEEKKRVLIQAVADKGQATGLENAATILREMANSHMLVVGTNAIRELAQVFDEKAAKMRATAETKLREVGAP